jgi:hypothetical protein
MSRQAPQGRIISGLGLGCATQIVLFLLGLMGTSIPNHPRLEMFFLLGWGLTQWIVLIPLIIRLRKQGQKRTIQGILIAGGIGVLLSSACASILSDMGSMH